MSSSGWDNFWTDQRHSFNKIMKISTTFFAVKTVKMFQLKSIDEVLDYGCGPGFFADYLRTKQISITGVDINDFFIAECKKNHPDSFFFKISVDIDLNKKLFDEKVGETKFDFIILLSISQYFKNVEHLDSIIRMLNSYTTTNGKIILADVIDPSTSSFKDAGALLIHCIKVNKIKDYVTFMFYLLFSSYRKISRTVKLLSISQDEVYQIANNNLLDCKSIKGLTIHSSRTNYVFTKRNRSF